MASAVAPENCPEPFWHETHMYCPCCTWVFSSTEERREGRGARLMRLRSAMHRLSASPERSDAILADLIAEVLHET